MVDDQRIVVETLTQGVQVAVGQDGVVVADHLVDRTNGAILEVAQVGGGLLEQTVALHHLEGKLGDGLVDVLDAGRAVVDGVLDSIRQGLGAGHLGSSGAPWSGARCMSYIVLQMAAPSILRNPL